MSSPSSPQYRAKSSLKVADTGSGASSTWCPSSSSSAAASSTARRVSSSVGVPVTESTIRPTRNRVLPGARTCRTGGSFGLRQVASIPAKKAAVSRTLRVTTPWLTMRTGSWFSAGRGRNGPGSA